MYNVSADYLEALKEPIQKYKLLIDIDGTQITDEDIVAGSFTLANQCSDTDIVQIGSVYCAELKFTIAPDIIERNTWQGATVTASEGIPIGDDLEDPDAFEFVPLGVFYVAEANHTEQGVNITAYDIMLNFDKSFLLTSTAGQPWDILSLLCADCLVPLGMTQAEVEALPNGTAQIALYPENDIQTYRDAVFWLAQLLGCFTTINRSGELVLRQYTDQTTQEIGQAFRYEGSSFSDFVTEYSGISYIDIETQEYVYISGGEGDNKLTYDLGANPFLQYGTDTTRKQMARNILEALKKIKYTPFLTRYLNTPAFDLGDVIKNAGGIGAGTLGCIMSFEYSFTKRYTAEGFGQNPALANARDKVTKDIAGLVSKTNKNEIQYYNFRNAAALEIGDQAEQEIINIRFTTQESRQVVFQAEILADADVTAEDLAAAVTYKLNTNEITGYKPVETWSEDGGHIISLFYVIEVDPNTLYQWQVFIESNGGTISIPVDHARATVWGQGLTALDKWGGFIDAEDTVGLIPIDDGIEVAQFWEEVTAAADYPETIEPEDTVGAIPINDGIEVAPFTDIIYIDKTSLYYEGITWGDIQADLWQEVKDEHVW